MLNYIRAEFYKVLRRKYVWITLAVMLGLEALLVLGWASIHINGVKVDFSSGITGLIFVLDLGFYATLLTGDMVFAGQYRCGTLKNEVSFGLSRVRIYWGKLVSQTALSILACVVLIGFYLALCAATQSHDRAQDGEMLQALVCCLATAFPLWVGGQAVTCAMYFLIASGLGAVCAALGVIAVLPGVLYISSLIVSGSNGHPVGNGLMVAYQYMPRTVLSAAQSTPGDWSLCGKAWIVGAAWFAAFTAIGLCGFRKKEIK